MGAQQRFSVARHVERGRWHGESKTGAIHQLVRPEEIEPIRSESMVLKKRRTEDDVDEEIPVDERQGCGVLLTMEDVTGRNSDYKVRRRCTS